MGHPKVTRYIRVRVPKKRCMLIYVCEPALTSGSLLQRSLPEQRYLLRSTYLPAKTFRLMSSVNGRCKNSRRAVTIQ